MQIQNIRKSNLVLINITLIWTLKIQSSYFEADVNDLIVVICKNNGGDMGIKGYINFNGFNYVTWGLGIGDWGLGIGRNP